MSLKMERKEEKEYMTFYVKDMMCNHCVAHVKEALTVDGVKSVDIDLQTKKVVVDTSLSQQEIFDLVKKAGYQPTED